MAFIEKFSPEILEELGSYVYKLIDPRDGSVFYVGKGKGNRVFAHMKAALKSGDLYRDEEEISLKLKTIREIIHEQLKPLHIIHRHGLTEKEAELVEAVLIDATPGLTNIMGGIGSNDKGPASAEQIQRRYTIPNFWVMVGKAFRKNRSYNSSTKVWRPVEVTMSAARLRTLS